MNIKIITKLFMMDNVVIRGRKQQINCRMADGFFTRLRGLLWAKPLNNSDGLLLTPCNSIHTIGMAYPIDVLFLSPNFQIVHIVSNCQSNRCATHKQAKHTLEMLAGQAASLELKVGMQLSIEQKK